MKLKMLTKGYLLLGVFLMMLSSSCKKEEKTSDVYTLRQWKSTDLSPSNVVPGIADRTDHAVAVFYLMTDNKLYYYIYFDKALQNGDTPGKAMVYTGAAGVNGSVLIDLTNPAFDVNREVKGSVVLSAQQIADLNSKTLYLQVASGQQAGGLVRGQLVSY